MSRRVIALLLLIFSLHAVLGHAQQRKVIKMGTLAPAGSPWHDSLVQLQQQWRKISGGTVELNIFPGGTQGDEPEMVRKMRNRQLQAVALSGPGMSQIEPGIACLQIPMMFQSYEELDYVRDRMAPRLEQMILARKYVVLNWGDAGWVHFFSRKPIRRLDEVRQMRLFTWAGDQDVLELWKANGFNAVPRPATEIVSGLQTDAIDVVPTVPLFATWAQLYVIAKYMNDVKWAPLIGATVISKEVWDSIPANLHDEMLKAAHEAGDSMRGNIRKMGDDAIAAMEKKKLTVYHADAATIADWRKQTEAVYPKMRGKTVPADLFDAVVKLRDEYQAQRSRGAKK